MKPNIQIIKVLVAFFLSSTNLPDIVRKLLGQLQELPPDPAEALTLLQTFIREAAIVHNQSYPLFVSAGAAYGVIAEQKLYLKLKDKDGEAKYTNFGSFCLAELGTERSRAYRQIKGSKIFSHFLEKKIEPLPENFNQMEHLVPLKESDAARAWKDAVDQSGNAQVTGRKVKQIVQESGLRSEWACAREGPTRLRLNSTETKTLREHVMTLIRLADGDTAKRTELVRKICEMLDIELPAVADSATATGHEAAGADNTPDLNDAQWKPLDAAKICRSEPGVLLLRFTTKSDPRLRSMKTTAVKVGVPGKYNLSQYPEAWAFIGDAASLDDLATKLSALLGPKEGGQQAA
jgi:hypothetical protein